MSIHKEVEYHFSVDAVDHLADMFAGLRIGSNSPLTEKMEGRGTYAFDGSFVARRHENRVNGTHSISHSLNLLAMYLDLTDWQDNRNDMQLRSCESQLNPPIPKNKQEALEYINIYGQPTGRALWSNHGIVEPPNDYPFKHGVHLRLSEGARDYYYRLAVMHKMRVLTIANNHSKTGYISAALEAIGSKWLVPPLYYKIVILAQPNPNIRSNHNKQRKADVINYDRFSPENYARIQELKKVIPNAQND